LRTLLESRQPPAHPHGVGKKTLLIDIDPQCNSSRYLLGEAAKQISPTVAGYFEQTLNFIVFSLSARGYVHETGFENLSLMPSHPEIGELQSKLESRHKIFKLRDALNWFRRQSDLAASPPLPPASGP
jgi:chromosome partitioning protein